MEQIYSAVLSIPEFLSELFDIPAKAAASFLTPKRISCSLALAKPNMSPPCGSGPRLKREMGIRFSPACLASSAARWSSRSGEANRQDAYPLLAHRLQADRPGVCTVHNAALCDAGCSVEAYGADGEQNGLLA